VSNVFGGRSRDSSRCELGLLNCKPAGWRLFTQTWFHNQVYENIELLFCEGRKFFQVAEEGAEFNSWMSKHNVVTFGSTSDS
jgi:hypothetical protein